MPTLKAIDLVAMIGGLMDPDPPCNPHRIAWIHGCSRLPTDAELERLGLKKHTARHAPAVPFIRVDMPKGSVALRLVAR